MRNRVTALIQKEFEEVKEGLGELFPQPLTQRRPRFRFTVERRVEPLRALHQRQVSLLAEWRQAESAGGELSEKLLGELRQTISAIAAGLRTTG